MISELLVILKIPYRGERISEDVAKTYPFLPVFLTAENPFKRRRQRWVEIDAGRDLSIDGNIKVTKWVLFTHRYINSR